MIRDPSDGTVRTAEEINAYAKEIKAVAPKKALKGISLDTGIRQPTRTDAQERLERSREWLKQYHTKDTGHAGGNDGEKYQAGGRSGNDQGQAESDISGCDGSDSGTSRQG